MPKRETSRLDLSDWKEKKENDLIYKMYLESDEERNLEVVVLSPAVKIKYETHLIMCTTVVFSNRNVIIEL